MARKSELPGWFPFALTASFLLMLGAGIKSGWRGTPQQPPKPTPPPPAPGAQQGVLSEWF